MFDKVILFCVIYLKVKTKGTLYMNKIFTISSGYNYKHITRQCATVKHLFLNVLCLDLYY